MANAEALDEVRADRRGGTERDLLRRDRDHERLERLRIERRPESRKRLDDPLQHGIVRCPGPEGGEIEGQAEETSDLERRGGAPGLDADTAGSCRDPHLPPVDDPMERAIAPDGRSVGAEVAKLCRRDGEVVRSRDLEEHRSELARDAVEVLERLEGDPDGGEVPGEAGAREDARGSE